MTKSKKSLTIFLLLMINLATVLSIRNWPVTAVYGYTSIFYLILSVIFFFLPCALVAAELATLLPKKGGIFIWVKEALGHRTGFLAIWILWAGNVVFYSTILSFVSAALAYAFFPSLADNPIYTCCTVILVFWAVTLINLRGISFTARFSTFCVIVGTFIPAALIIILGGIWVFSGAPLMISLSTTPLVPDFTGIGTFAVITGVLLGFAGIEMPAIHAGDVKNPKRTFPIAMFLSATIIVVLTVLGTLCIAFVVPQEKISFVSGTVEAMSIFLSQYNMSFLTPVVALLIAIGALGGVSNWIVGPCRGLLVAAENGDLPPLLQRTNKHDMPHVLMILQGVIVTFLSIFFILMPNVSSSYWMMTVLSSQCNTIMYMLLFVSGIVLKYTKADAPRAYEVPGGNAGMWIAAGLGIIGVVFAFIVGFFPPEDIPIHNIALFETFLFLGISTFIAAPFIIYAFRKPSWKKSVK